MSTLTSAQKWMVNAGAIIADDNGLSTDELYAFDPYDHEKSSNVREMLNRDWGVGDKKGLLEVTDQLSNGQGGHNPRFCQIRDYWARFSSQQVAYDMRRYSDDELSDIQLVLTHSQTLGSSGILSWDLGRCVPLLRDGYSLSWFTKEETWEKLNALSINMQQSYNSWEHAGTAYIVGRLFWAKGGLSESTCNDYFGKLKRIITNPEHAWNTIAWDTKLV